ncbi:MAG TPA: GNAT family N-acetyltransferase [Chloroflexota bacterium]|jgi:predicted GNAT family N-acyltransferase|nr:GNAT family N-acetyltransferase [Chloroflexota bacterium]
MSEIRCVPVNTPDAWAQVVAIRMAVFVQEQGVPAEEELDAYDPVALHLLAFLDEQPVGTGRLVVDGAEGIIGRLAVLPEARRRGVGSALLRTLLAHARQHGLPRVRLAAQLHARPFYARFGFVARGPYFLDGGLWHQRMELDLLRASTAAGAPHTPAADARPDP